ncbi:MAG: zf-HC2 domain-containing protein [Corynebacterium sp.]|uniref:anti-sigma factor family protein n=1 Tax=Corynebacterium sp. TaxID=1720 RepID=UPI0026DAC7FF|nr:zf-HC2 domain-containing protein [Corynebacterium sp.]MDO5029455.1 zf-HC2 domain-containing protein [Corynebacterium sp.]
MIRQDHESRFLSTEHLGTEAIAAFVDGELSPAAERRAQAHLMACSSCRREVAKQRQAAKRLRDSQALHIPAEVRARLAGLAGEYENRPQAPRSSVRYLVHRRPESLSAALEQIVRDIRKGGSH